MIAPGSALRRMLGPRLSVVMRIADLDRAVVIVMLGRLWAMGAGVVTIGVVTARMDAGMQGYHYTFLSLLGLQTFAELNLSYVIVQFAAHEWARLRLDQDGAITGDADAHSRLASIARFALRWYATAAVLFVVGGSAAGAWLLSGGAEAVAWQAPWAALMIAAAAQLLLVPLLALLEGAHQVDRVYSIRLVAGIGTSVATWLVLLAGGGLWAAPAGLAVGVAVTAAMIATRHLAFVGSLLHPPVGEQVQWREEVWQMQWRLGVTGIGNYFIAGLLVPVVFHYHGAAEAGRLGVGLQLTASITTLAVAWITPRIPRFGTLIAQRRYEELDRLFLRSISVSTTAAVLAGLTLVGGALIAGAAGIGIMQRIASPTVLAILATAAVVTQLNFGMAAYLRAHRRDPLVLLSLVASLCTGTLVWWLGSRYGATGAVLAQLIVLGGLALPVTTGVWVRLRSQWHR